MHPAQIPFIVKAEPAVPNVARAVLKGRGILRHKHHARKKIVQSLVQLLQEPDAILVGSPRRIAHPVYHVADGIHAQPVKMVHFQPVRRG